MSLFYPKFKTPQCATVQLILLIWFGLLTSSQLYAEPPRLLHTTFEQYAKQQQQHDQQLMNNQVSANSNATSKTQPSTKAASTSTSNPTSKPISKASSAKNNATPVNINQADESSLAAALVGVGPAKAKAIVAYRQQNGAFKRVEDLVLVKGIGPATLEKNRDRLRLN